MPLKIRMLGVTFGTLAIALLTMAAPTQAQQSPMPPVQPLEQPTTTPLQAELQPVLPWQRLWRRLKRPPPLQPCPLRAQPWLLEQPTATVELQPLPPEQPWLR